MDRLPVSSSIQDQESSDEECQLVDVWEVNLSEPKWEEQSPFLTLRICLWLPSAREVLVQECQNQSSTMKNPRLYLPLGVATRGKMPIANHVVGAQKTATEWVTSLWYSFWKRNSRHSESFSLFSVSRDYLY